MSETSIELANRPIERVASDLVVIPLFENERPLRDAAARVDWRLCGRFSMLLESGRCDGHRNEAVLVPSTGGIRAPLVMGLGLGDRGELNLEQWSGWLGSALARAAGLRANRITLALPECVPSPAECLEQLLAAAASASPDELSLVPEPLEWKPTADWLQRAAAQRERAGVRLRAPAESSAPRGARETASQDPVSANPMSSRSSADRFSR